MGLSIFIGTTNIASQLGDFKAGFEQLGHRVSIGVLQGDYAATIQKQAYDYVFLPRLPFGLAKYRLLRKLWPRVLQKIQPFFLSARRIPEEIIAGHEVFIFIWSSFDIHFRDYARLVAAGKKVVVLFCGDDARWHAGVNQEFRQIGLDPVPYQGKFLSLGSWKIHLLGYDFTYTGLQKRMEAIRNAEKFADLVFSKREQSQLQLRPFFHYPMHVHPEGIPCRATQRRDNPVVVHAPSDQLVKGTAVVLQVFEQLKAAGVAFQPVLLSGVPNAEALALYKDADIVIDQLILPGGGRLSTEAMAAGCVVLSRMEYARYPQGIDLADCPIVDVEPASLYDVLKNLIQDYPRRQQLAERGRPYVESHLSTQRLCQKILAELEATDPSQPAYDYAPTFFRTSFLPQSMRETRLLNRWTRYVAGCAWYSRFVPAGERSGLKF